MRTFARRFLRPLAAHRLKTCRPIEGGELLPDYAPSVLRRALRLAVSAARHIAASIALSINGASLSKTYIGTQGYGRYDAIEMPHVWV